MLRLSVSASLLAHTLIAVSLRYRYKRLDPYGGLVDAHSTLALATRDLIRKGQPA
ncbi:hypothetical protein [Rhodococcus sp. AW25M09]|uniref:hypothetical protein n=1 Tax=Rhodococcus sp. AW25M09 TaxID=1268303 RepID=UPI00034D8219|nr:hypothetical protein [Rhodococcus sp. AW25M09]